MNPLLREWLNEDIEQIREGLLAFADYDFAADIQSHMSALSLSSLALGTRCCVSHTIVDKWRQGKAKPNGKERYKELGMALGMDERSLNGFLYQNGYPKLYAKNPLDSAAKLILMNSAAREDIVALYRNLLDCLGFSDFAPLTENEPLKTWVMSRELHEAAQAGGISMWFRNHRNNFAGGAKTQLPDSRIVGFIMLYIGDTTIHEMVVSGELPVTLKSLLYALAGRRAVHVRGLREKLIAFGLYANMTEEEIDTLLSYARLRMLSEPVTSADFAVLCALRNAHERYPHYEADSLKNIVSRLSASNEAYDRTLLNEYTKRLHNAEQRAAYYDKHSRTEEELLFEQSYTAYADRGVMDYVNDMLMMLAEYGDIPSEQAKPFMDLIKRTREGEDIWS